MKNSNLARYSLGIITGHVLRLTIGIAIGKIGLGIAIGLPIGVGFGFVFTKKNKLK